MNNGNKNKSYTDEHLIEYNKHYLEMSRKHNKKRYKEAQKIMAHLKINGCAICGYNKCNACLDFHHVNPEDKKFQVNIRGLGLKDNRIITELNKCILLCNRCHKEIERC